MENKGQMMMVNLLFMSLAVLVLIALIPALNAILNVAQQSDNLNCPGYDYGNSGVVGDNVLDYNSSLTSNTLACIAIDLYLPYLIIVILLGGIAKVMASRIAPSPVESSGY